MMTRWLWYGSDKPDVYGVIASPIEVMRLQSLSEAHKKATSPYGAADNYLRMTSTR